MYNHLSEVVGIAARPPSLGQLLVVALELPLAQHLVYIVVLPTHPQGQISITIQVGRF